MSYSKCQVCLKTVCDCRHDNSESEIPSIFLSWSGEQAKNLALALRTAIVSVFSDLRVFFSDEDIVAGDAWLKRLQDELTKSQFGIFALTPESIESRWVALEFGAIAKHFGASRVVPIAIDIEPTDIPAPFNIFQAVRLDSDDRERNRNSFFHLMESIGLFMCGSQRKGHLVLRRVEEAWRVLEHKLFRISNSARTPISANCTLNAFNAYFGPEFEEAFLNALKRSQRLRAASVGLAMLYMSPRVEDEFVSRLTKRELDVELIYQHPEASNYSVMYHPDYESQDSTGNATHAEDLKTFLARLMQLFDKTFREEGAEIQEDESGKSPQQKQSVTDSQPTNTSAAESSTRESFEVRRFRPPLAVDFRELRDSLKEHEKIDAAMKSCSVRDEALEKLATDVQLAISLLNNRKRILRDLMASPINLKIAFTKLFYYHSIIMFDDDMFVFWYGHEQQMHREPVIHVSRVNQPEIWEYFMEQYKMYSSKLVDAENKGANEQFIWFGVQQDQVNGSNKQRFEEFLEHTKPQQNGTPY